MGLLDTLNAQTDEGRQLRGGLLNMGIGLLSGSTGNYGQFAPALAQGFAGFQQGQQQVIDDKFKKAQTEQMQAYRNMQIQSMAQTQQQQQEAQDIISSGIDPQTALRHANPHVREWASGMANIDYRDRALNARGVGGMSGLVPTTQGYAYRDDQGNTQFLTGTDGKPLMPTSAAALDPATQGQIAESRAYGTESGKNQAGNEAGFGGAMANVDLMLGTIDKALNHPGLSRSTGMMSMIPDRPGSDAADFKAVHNQIAGQVFLDAFERLKGAGAITDMEGNQARNAAARLDLAQSEEAYKSALTELKDITNRGRQRLIDRVGGGGSGGGYSTTQQSASQPQAKKRVVKTGTHNGRKVAQYDDGSMAYLE